MTENAISHREMLKEHQKNWTTLKNYTKICHQFQEMYTSNLDYKICATILMTAAVSEITYPICLPEAPGCIVGRRGWGSSPLCTPFSPPRPAGPPPPAFLCQSGAADSDGRNGNMQLKLSRHPFTYLQRGQKFPFRFLLYLL